MWQCPHDERTRETPRSLATDGEKVVTSCISIQCKWCFCLFTTPLAFGVSFLVSRRDFVYHLTVKDRLQTTGVVDLVGSGQFYETLQEGMDSFNEGRNSNSMISSVFLKSWYLRPCFLMISPKA